MAIAAHGYLDMSAAGLSGPGQEGKYGSRRRSEEQLNFSMQKMMKGKADEEKHGDY
jgi:hypothetical protein